MGRVLGQIECKASVVQQVLSHSAVKLRARTSLSARRQSYQYARHMVKTIKWRSLE